MSSQRKRSKLASREEAPPPPSQMDDDNDEEEQKTLIDDRVGTIAAQSALSILSAADALAPPRDFQPGSIRRVRLHDFMTHADAEFEPGPGLNLIIGPNGTGF